MLYIILKEGRPLSGVLPIAMNEFSRIMRQPIILVIAAILFLILLVNGASSAQVIPEFLPDKDDVFLKVGVSNTMYYTSLFLSVVSMFIGVLSIAEERSRGTLRVLLAKPVFRKDVFFGKFLGISMLLLILTVTSVTLCVSAILIFYGGPLSLQDALIRLSTYTMLIFLNCVLTVAIAMLIGVAVKNILGILMLAGSLLCFEWFINIEDWLSSLLGSLKYIISQKMLFFTIMGPTGPGLLHTTMPYQVWLEDAAPYITAFLLEIIVVLVLAFLAFNGDDE